MASPFFDRAKAVFFAKLAEQTGRYDDMVDAMKNLAENVAELTPYELNLLSDAYKMKILSLRESWRILSAELHKYSTYSPISNTNTNTNTTNTNTNTNTIIQFLKLVEAEMGITCNDVILIINNHLIPSCNDPITTVFCLKMKGDYFRCLAEIRTGDRWKVVVSESINAYQYATYIARAELPPTNPLRLGVALNFSVFYYDILGLLDRACEMAENAFNEAISGLHIGGSLNEEAMNDRIHLMQLLRDNVLLWKAIKSRGNMVTLNVPPVAING